MDAMWLKTYNLVKQYTETEKECPKKKIIYKGTKIGGWCDTQRKCYKNKKLSKERIDKLQAIDGWYWDYKKRKKSMLKPKVKKPDIQSQRRTRVKSEISILHQKYKTMNSQNLHQYFKEKRGEWVNYHTLAEANEESFPEDEIPYKRIINYLEKIPGKRKKIIADLGCGKAKVSEYFKDNTRFTFHNFDHVAINDSVISKDIKNTELDEFSIDYGILCLAMWGSNCKEYLLEVYRILDNGGKLLIIEPFKRWNKDEKEGNRLTNLLKDTGFNIKNIKEEKFMFIECIK